MKIIYSKFVRFSSLYGR